MDQPPFRWHSAAWERLCTAVCRSKALVSRWLTVVWMAGSCLVGNGGDREVELRMNFLVVPFFNGGTSMNE